MHAAKAVAKLNDDSAIYFWPPLYKRTSGGQLQCWRIKVYINVPEVGQAEICTRWGLNDSKAKQTAFDVISTGKQSTTPVEQAVLEAHARWIKQQERKKYSLDKTGNASAAKRQLAPMLASKYKDAKKHIDWERCYVQPKLDGFRCIARRQLDGVVLMSRGFKVFNAPHIEKALMGILKNVGSSLDGELYVHGKPINQIASAVNRGEPVDKDVEYHVYDTDSYNGSFDKRRFYYTKLLLTGKFSSSIVEVPTFKVSNEKELMKMHKKFIKAGYEGTIIRHGELPYENDKRSKGLIKLKTLSDEEFKIVGAKTGRGKFQSCCIFECETAAGHRFEVPAPGTLKDRKEYWIYRKEYIGDMLTVKFPCYTKTDKPVPFHPVAVRTRPPFDRDNG